MRAKIVKQAKLALAGQAINYFLCGINIEPLGFVLRCGLPLLRHGIHLLIREGFVQNEHDYSN